MNCHPAATGTWSCPLSGTKTFNVNTKLNTRQTFSFLSKASDIKGWISQPVLPTPASCAQQASRPHLCVCMPMRVTYCHRHACSGKFACTHMPMQGLAHFRTAATYHSSAAYRKDTAEAGAAEAQHRNIEACGTQGSARDLGQRHRRDVPPAFDYDAGNSRLNV